MDQLSQDRLDAIRIMQSDGWTWKKNGSRHEFWRPDGDGNYDFHAISNKHLTSMWALMRSDDEVHRRLDEVKAARLREVIADIRSSE